MKDNMKETASRLPEWEKPAVVALGGLASGQGADAQKCNHGTAVSQVCGNGSSPQVDQCKSGNNPPSNSCASGSNGT